MALKNIAKKLAKKAAKKVAKKALSKSGKAGQEGSASKESRN